MSGGFPPLLAFLHPEPTCSPARPSPGSLRMVSSTRAETRVIAPIPGTKRNNRLKNSTSLFMNKQKPRSPMGAVLNRP